MRYDPRSCRLRRSSSHAAGLLLRQVARSTFIERNKLTPSRLARMPKYFFHTNATEPGLNPNADLWFRELFLTPSLWFNDFSSKEAKWGLVW
jgi:hypothetical protein